MDKTSQTFLLDAFKHAKHIIPEDIIEATWNEQKNCIAEKNVPENYKSFAIQSQET